MNLKEQLETWRLLSRILGPAFAAMVCIYGGLGVFIYFMYTFNVEHNIVKSFPSQFMIYLFFIVVLLSGVVVMLISLYQAIALTGKNASTSSS
ncbi:hypothetical protein [Brevibacillus choshinensis]|uniref:hypothetical protein n=1 Tax=Brevibacillus choshinensis TaxID=54911 RepID=UPI002E218308|nr:hypothetical protein [Brevibacillus choshinensis]